MTEIVNPDGSTPTAENSGVDGNNIVVTPNGNYLQFPSDLDMGTKKDKEESGGSEAIDPAYLKIQILDPLLADSDPDGAIIENIFMFAPAGFTLEDGANYGTINFGVTDALESTTKDIITKAGTNDPAKIQGASQGEIAVIMQALTQQLGIENAGLAEREAFKRRAVLNNKATATFEGMNIRSYQLAFNLVSSNEKDAKCAYVIEHTLRKNMYPVSDGDFALKYPPEFLVTFMRGKEPDPFMPKLKPCYLTGLSAQYNANSNMFHPDGSPTDVTLTLSLQETKQLLRSDLYPDGPIRIPQARQEGDE